ncbi:MAG: hypothetical protein IPM55_22890 [Acidobacteria bacterium]|nr:hypothetical protein [Acidobacteriota bacterium]
MLKRAYRATVDDLKRILMIETVKGPNAEVGRIWNEIGKVHNRFGDCERRQKLNLRSGCGEDWRSDSDRDPSGTISAAHVPDAW